MKLSVIASILSDNIEQVKLEKLQPQPGTSTATANLVKLHNLKEFRTAIENINSTGLFGGEALVDRLKELPIFSNALDSFDITVQQHQELVTVTSRLYLVGYHTLRAIRQAIPSVDPNSVSVRLPVTKSISEMASVLKIVDRAFSQGIINEIGGKVEVETVEPGSIWLIIGLGVPAAVTLIGSLVWAGVVIAQQRNSNSLLEKEIEKRDLQNGFLKSLIDDNQKRMKVLVESEAKLILEENFQVDNEQLERLKLSIESFTELILKGSEVHPVLHAPDAVKVSFPPFNSLNLIESRIQKLAQHNNSGSGSSS